MATKQELLQALIEKKKQTQEPSVPTLSAQQATSQIMPQQGLVGQLFGGGVSQQVQDIGREAGLPVQRAINTAAFGLPATTQDPLEREITSELQPQTKAGQIGQTGLQVGALLGGGTGRSALALAKGGRSLLRQSIRGGAAFGALNISDVKDDFGEQVLQQTVQAAEGAATGAAFGIVATPIANLGSSLIKASNLAKAEGISFPKAFGAVKETEKLAKFAEKANKLTPVVRDIAKNVNDISNKTIASELQLRNSVKDALLTQKETVIFKNILRKLPSTIKNNLKKQDLELVKRLTQKGKSPTQISLSDSHRLKTNIGDVAFKNRFAIERGDELIEQFNQAKEIAKNATARELVKKGTFGSESAAKLALTQADDNLSHFYTSRSNMYKKLYEAGDPRKSLDPRKLANALGDEKGRSELVSFFKEYGQSSSRLVNQSKKIIAREKLKQGIKKNVGFAAKTLFAEEVFRRGLLPALRGGDR